MGFYYYLTRATLTIYQLLPTGWVLNIPLQLQRLEFQIAFDVDVRCLSSASLTYRERYLMRESCPRSGRLGRLAYCLRSLP